MKAVLPLVVGILLVGALASPAWADKQSAQAHYRKGMKQYNLGHFREAIAAFEQAYEADPAPVLLFNIAQSHRQLDEHERALFFYRRYLDADPDAKNRAAVERRMAELRAALQSATAPPSPANNQAPAAPVREPATAENTVSQPAKPSVVDVPPAVIVTPPPETPPTQSPSTLRWAAHGTAGMGAVAVIAGLTFGWMADSAGDMQSQADVYDRDADQAGKSKETLQYVSYGVGVAALATAAVLYHLDARAPTESVALVPLVSPQSTGVGARVVF